MSDTIIPSSELLVRALQWIAERRQEEPTLGVVSLVEEAGLRFDLSPRQAEWLLHTLGLPPEASARPHPPDGSG